MMSYEVSLLDYDELSEDEQEEFCYGEDDTYLKVNGRLYSDGYEPEDVRFCRDLSWVPTEIEKAYKAGYDAGYDEGHGLGFDIGYGSGYDEGYGLGFDIGDG